MVPENNSIFSFDDPSSIVSIIAIFVSIASVIITFLIYLINKRMYNLAYEQDLLMRKEKHFNELKQHAIEPLLYDDKLPNLSPFFFIDLIRHHYPELGVEMKKLAKIYFDKISIKNKIIELSLRIIKEKEYENAIQFDINKQLLDRELPSLLYIIEKHPQVNKYVEIKPQKRNGVDYYSLYLFSTKVYENEKQELVSKAKNILINALEEIKNNKEIRKLVKQYREIDSRISCLREKIRHELKRLLEQPSTALRLVNNRLCPYMKGEEDEEITIEEKVILDVMKEELPERKHAAILA